MADTAISYETGASAPAPRRCGAARWTVLCLVFLAAALILGCVAAIQPAAALAAPPPRTG